MSKSAGLRGLETPPLFSTFSTRAARMAVTLRRLTCFGAGADVERLLEESSLPDSATDLIRRVVRRTRLRASERRDVAEEFTCHFLDGLQNDVAIAELLSSFGHEKDVSALVRRAKIRQRSIVQRTAQQFLVVLVGLVAVTGLAYGWSAASLYLNQNATVIDPEFTAREVEKLWLEIPPETQRIAQEGRRATAGARVAISRGEFHEVPTHLSAALAVAARLRAERRAPSEKIAAAIESAALALFVDSDNVLVESHDPAWRRFRDLLDEPLRLDGVRSAFHHVLDNMYTNNGRGSGHLTSDGIELVRTLKRWSTLKDRLMEPAWYAFPASRARVQSRFESLVRLAEDRGSIRHADQELQSAIAPFRASVVPCLRYPSLSAVLPDLVEILTLTIDSQRYRAMALDRLNKLLT